MIYTFGAHIVRTECALYAHHECFYRVNFVLLLDDTCCMCRFIGWIGFLFVRSNLHYY